VNGDPVNHRDSRGLYDADWCDPDDPDDCEDPTYDPCDDMFGFMEVSSCPDGAPGVAWAAAPPLTCSFVGASFGTAQAGSVEVGENQTFNGYAIPVSLTFTASGGSGSYNLIVAQVLENAGFIDYLNGAVYNEPVGSIQDTVMPSQITSSGVNLTFSD